MPRRPSCDRCGTSLPVLARSSTRYCSTRCRVAAHRAGKASAVPAELLERPRWVRYSARKVPLTVAGRPASSTNPRTWCSHESAASSGAGVGLGFVLAGDGIVCLDLDHCLVDGAPTTDAAAVLAAVPGTYVEVSPSGEGLHVWGLADLERDGRVLVAGVRVEAYSRGRFITVTGRRFGSAPSRLAQLILVG